MRTALTAPVLLLTLLTLRLAHAENTQSTTETASPPPVQLEEPRPRQGHFIAVGFHGLSAMAFDENRGTRSPTFGQGVSLRLGESVTDWLNLSLAFSLGSTYGKAQDSLTLGRFGVSSQWYFSERWFVQAGLGAANAQGPDPENHDRSRGRFSAVYFTGLGHDFYISDRARSGGWVFTPTFTAELSPDSEFTTTSLWVGVEISWWTGLSRDKLKLETPKAYKK